jgi:hypothetical protein
MMGGLRSQLSKLSLGALWMVERVSWPALILNDADDLAATPIGRASLPLEPNLPYPHGALADPPITVPEALAVVLGRDTTACRWHNGQLDGI